MFNSKGAIPISPNVPPLAVFTFGYFLILFTLCEIFINNCCNMHEHLAAISNRAVTSSILRSLTAKLITLILCILD